MTENQDDTPTVVYPDTEDTKVMPEPSEFNTRSVLVLSATSLALFCTSGFLNAFGVFQTVYTRQYLSHYSSFQISWIGSFSIFILFGFGVPAGWVADIYGPTIPIALGSLCQLVAIFMISLCKEYYQFFLAQGVLLGFGMAFITIPTTAVVPLYFQRNRGFAQGVTISGSSLGGVIWPIMIDQLLSHDRVSFGWTMRIVGFMQIPILVLTVLGVRRPSSMRNAVKNEDQSSQTEKDWKDDKLEKVKQRKTELKRLRHPSFILFCCGLAIFYFGFFAPLFFVPTYAITLGISEGFSIYFISILNAASLFGRILPGFVADRVGHFNIMVISMFGSTLVCFCWTAVNNVAGLVVFSLAYGFISGAVLSLQFACISLVATKSTVGTAIGIAMASIALTNLFGTPIAGELVKSGFVALSCFAAAVMIVGGSFIVASRLSRNRKLLAKV